ncbi:hypothetical protein MPLSOD_330099 [Mesorhizobium sp. SOD10]|nr:hypothetical protein MPLSOD_330099 [Mesorhizobium sp. SOD10]
MRFLPHSSAVRQLKLVTGVVADEELKISSIDSRTLVMRPAFGIRRERRWHQVTQM